MRWHRPLFTTVGFGLVVFGLALLAVPAVSTVGPVRWLLSGVEAVGTTRMLLVTGGGLVGYLLVGLRSSTSAPEAVDQFRPAADDESGQREQIAGYELEQSVDAAVEEGGESFAAVREELRQAAAETYADVVGCSRARAWEMINHGRWCDDPLAAAFLADASGPSAPAETQLRLFVFPHHERRRRIDRTIAVIEWVERR